MVEDLGPSARSWKRRVALVVALVVAMGGAADAAAVDPSAILLPAGKSAAFSAHLRSTPPNKVLPLTVLTIEHDGHAYRAHLKWVDLPAGQSDLTL
jgi:hypothetical protein